MILACGIECDYSLLMGADGDERRVSSTTFRELIRARTFAVPYFAEMQSIAGDQLARVALSVLVYDRTGSGPATAAVYAATFLPAIVGGYLLGPLGDRFPRRLIMVASDVLRAACFVAMAVAGMPLAGIVALLVVAVFIGPAFAAAEVSYLAARLDDEQFRVASAMRLATSQAAQVTGFALGGFLVAFMHPKGALLVDAATFIVSAAVIGTLLPDGGSAADGHSRRSGARVGGHQAAFAVWDDRRLRALVALTVLVGFFVVPEGLAVPFGADIDASTGIVGILLASGALGGAVGAIVLVRFVRPARRAHLANWMAVGCGVPLVVTALAPPWPLTAACWLVSGALAAYVLEVMAMVVPAIPDSHRSRVVGVIGALLLTAQGVGLVGFGALTRVLSPAHAIAMAGLVGSLLALVLVIGPLRSRSEYSASHRAGMHGEFPIARLAEYEDLARSGTRDRYWAS